MNQTLHVMKKDARHLRRALLVWAVIVAAHVALDINRPSFELHGMAAAIVASQMASLISFIELVMTGLIVSLIVHEDSLVGREAFWLTRPLEPRRMAAAKLALALGVLILLPLAGDVVTIGTFHVGARNVFRALPPIVLARLASVLPLVVAAALTPSLARYVLLIVGAMGAFVLFMAVLMTGLLLFVKINESSSGAPELMDPVPSTVATIVVVAVSLWVIVYQYRRRQLKRAIIMTAAGLGVAILVPMIWPWRAAPPASDPGPWAHDDTHTVALVEPDPPQVSDEVSFNRRDSSTKQVAAHVRLAGIPGNFSVRSTEARSRFEVAGATIVSTPSRMITVRRTPAPGVTSDLLRPLQAALGDVRFVGGGGEEYDMWPVVLLVSDGEFSRYARTPGRLTAAIDFHVLRSAIAGEGPLQTGWTLQEAARRTQITRIDRRADGCTVILREILIEPLFTARAQEEEELVLRNSPRGEAVKGDQEWFGAENNSPIPFLLNVTLGVFGGGASGGRGYSVRNYAVRYPSRNSSASSVIDAAWLEDAKLVRVRKTYAGHVSRSVTVENFRMVQ